MLINPTFAFKNRDVKVGTYVYTWYNPSEPTSWEYPKITDKPLLDYYNSSNPIVIATQIQQIQNVGIDFVMLSWLNYAFSTQTIEAWYSVAKDNATSLKLSVMVEPYNETGTYNYTEIYNFAFNLFDNYKGHSLFLNGKPIIFFYNGGVLTGDTFHDFPQDDRFIVMTIGHREYVDFWYDDVRNYIPTFERNQISVLPRFDDYWQYYLGLRDHVHIIDRYLTEGLYQTQWERAIKRADKHSVEWITIATWNEYPERTAIEPHYDNTAYDKDPYYLYNMTKQYINELHGLSGLTATPQYWYQNPLFFGVIILGLCLGAWLVWKS